MSLAHLQLRFHKLALEHTQNKKKTSAEKEVAKEGIQNNHSFIK
jgi:hypothetical protein